MPKLVQPISIHHARRILLRALSIKVQVGSISGNFPLYDRHLPIHGGQLQDCRRGECNFPEFCKIADLQWRLLWKDGATEHNVFSKFSFTSNSDSYVSDGWCKQHILYTQYFTVCGSRLSRRFKTCRVCVCVFLTFFPFSRIMSRSHSPLLGLPLFTPASPSLSTSSISQWPLTTWFHRQQDCLVVLAIQSLLSWRRWRSTQITPRWRSFVKSETWCRWNWLLCRKISGIASSSWRCREISIGTKKTMKRLVKVILQVFPNMRKDCPSGHWTFLGFGSEEKRYATLAHKPDG